MRPTLAVIAAFAVGAVSGILLEHYVGTASIIDSIGLRHALVIHQIRRTGDRAEVPLAAVQGKRTMVALVFGQSNAANGGETPGAPHPAVYELFRGRLYLARDPLLGADGNGGSVWLRLGAKALASGEFDAVVLVPFAISATEIERWAPGGRLHDPLLKRIAQARDSGLRFTHLLWHQGEADAYHGTSEIAYRERFLAMLEAIRQRGVQAPIYVALASRCGRVPESASIRSAQMSLRNSLNGVFAGPDTDALGFAQRYDGCHFSTEGLERAAELWWNALRKRP